MSDLDKRFDLWLKASYRYYKQPDEMPLMGDGQYDMLSRELIGRYDELTHRFKDLACDGNFISGTGFDIQWTPESVEYVTALS